MIVTEETIEKNLKGFILEVLLGKQREGFSALGVL